MSLKAGDKAPDFTLPSDGNGKISLSKLKGKKVILYFYPKDDTSGCTAEACGFRDNLPKFAKSDAVVIGISRDNVASHDKFKKKYDLPFTLVADPEHEVAERYGVWGKKRYAGRTYMGVSRTTFLIAADGTVAKVMHDVKPDTHADDVLAALAPA